MNSSDKKNLTADTSGVWQKLTSPDEAPPGLSVRLALPSFDNGAWMVLEHWQAGSGEPPHSHPGDDMTVVIEGRMSVQFFSESDDGLTPDGDRVEFTKGDTGFIAAGRIHDAKYVEDCKLVYVHDGEFGFTPAGNSKEECVRLQTNGTNVLSD